MVAAVLAIFAAGMAVFCAIAGAFWLAAGAGAAAVVVTVEALQAALFALPGFEQS